MKPFIFLQHMLPQHALSRAAGAVAESRNPLVRGLAIRGFAKAYGITLDECAQNSFAEFESFNDFFTRALEPEARPIHAAQHSIVSPADGCISALGKIDKNHIFQAKGHSYTLEKLLGSVQVAHFYDGHFLTVYLAPSNYHRVHMPLTATLTATRYIPGRLFSVNDTTAQHVQGLFARNERMVCLFDVAHEGKMHKMAVVLVGAMIVAGIETVATGKVAAGRIQEQRHNLPLEKGAELGRFFLGSTAIVLLPRSLSCLAVRSTQAERAQTALWDVQLATGSTVRMGEQVGTVA